MHILPLLIQVADRAEITWVGVVVPGAIFLIAFVATWLLYRHFAKQVR